MVSNFIARITGGLVGLAASAILMCFLASCKNTLANIMSDIYQQIND